ncbi:MAG: GNAT family N-acetyltransferase [Deltaproteobacteria bacterium]|nr:GNAT family N-acetyltransferase [Deltaproteobacteria bacterium]
MKIEIVNPLKFNQWDEILLNHPEATIFHSSKWARVLCESYGYEPVYFAVFEQGALKLLLPFMDINSIFTGRRGVSLPFTDYCRIILPEKDNLPGVIGIIEGYGKQIGWKYFELRCDRNISDSFQTSTAFYRHILVLIKGEEALWMGLRGSTRRNVKKAEKAGITVVMDNSMEALRQFYRLNCLTRKSHGLPPQPFLFFYKLFEHILSKGFGIVALAYHGEKIVAGNIYLHFGRFAIYKYGASDKRYQLLRANNLLQWEAIRWYANRGFHQLCLGRTEMENNGLLQFKRGWGADEKKLFYHKYDLRETAFVNDTSQVTGFHKKLFSAMSLPLLRLVGRILYRHIG